MRSAAPSRVGKYEIVRSIGRGGMAEVFLARLPGADDLHREVVIKRVLEAYSDDEGFVSMFRDEARITAQLRHGNIVQVLEFGHDQSGYFLALEYVDGPTLATVLRIAQAALRPLPHAVVAYVLVEVAAALDYAHRKRGPDGELLGVVHRDVSPSNVLISRDGEVKLADFGIARASDRVSTTATGAVKGKVNYMAPEALDGKPEPRSDLFALGAIAYEMIAGEPPFRGDSVSATVYRVLTEEPPSLIELDRETPPALDAMVKRLLARELTARPERGAEIVAELTPIVLSAGRPGAELLAEFVAELGVPPADPPATQILPSRGSRPRALVVERSPTARAALRASLASDIDVVEVDNAEAALTHIESTPFDLVVSQQLLPQGVTGIELCRQIRAGTRDANVRFVLLVADDSPTLADDARRAGVDAVIVKRRFDVLVSTVRELLGSTER